MMITILSKKGLVRDNKIKAKEEIKGENLTEGSSGKGQQWLDQDSKITIERISADNRGAPLEEAAEVEQKKMIIIKKMMIIKRITMIGHSEEGVSREEEAGDR